MTSQKVLTVVELEGMYPDDEQEQRIFNALPEHPYRVNFIRAGLAPGDAPMRPISDLSDEFCAQVDGLMVFRHFFTADDLERFTNLKVVVRMGVGYDRLDRKALNAKGVVVCNVPDYGTAEIADHALALALSLRRGVIVHHELQRHSPPAPWVFAGGSLVSRIQGSTFGVLGLGRIGTAAALRARAFGWHIIFFDPYLPNGVDRSLGFERARSAEDLFRRSSILSIHCPSTSETAGMVGSSLISLLPDGAIIVNTARGTVLDLDAVEAALRSGKLAGAGLDVLPIEPPVDPVHPLVAAYRRKEAWLEGRLVITPHSAYYSPQSFEDIRTLSAETMRNVLIDGKRDMQGNVITPDME